MQRWSWKSRAVAGCGVVTTTVLLIANYQRPSTSTLAASTAEVSARDATAAAAAQSDGGAASASSSPVTVYHFLVGGAALCVVTVSVLSFTYYHRRRLMKTLLNKQWRLALEQLQTILAALHKEKLVMSLKYPLTDLYLCSCLDEQLKLDFEREIVLRCPQVTEFDLKRVKRAVRHASAVYGYYFLRVLGLYGDIYGAKELHGAQLIALYTEIDEKDVCVYNKPKQARWRGGGGGSSSSGGSGLNSSSRGVGELPAYYIAVDHQIECIVVSVRGTLDANDLAIDLQVDVEEMNVRCEGAGSGSGGGGGSGGDCDAGEDEAAANKPVYAHSGFLSSAVALLRDARDALCAVVARHRGYRLLFTGHSLGAAVASLCCILINHAMPPAGANDTAANRDRDNRRNNSHSADENDGGGSGAGRGSGSPYLPHLASPALCFGFGTPPCIGRGAYRVPPALHCEHITTLIAANDIIPRLSVASVTRLLYRLRDIDRLPLSTTDRLSLVARHHRGGGREVVAALREQLAAARDAERGEASVRLDSEHHVIPPLQLPGRILWHARAAAPSEEDARAWRAASAEHFDDVLLSQNMWMSHLCGAYEVNLNAYHRGLGT